MRAEADREGGAPAAERVGLDRLVESSQRFARTVRGHRMLAALDVVRVLLGVGLVARGLLFLADSDSLLRLVEERMSWLWPVAVAHYVGAVHVAGGLLLAIGLLTRIAAIVQLPALLGAVFFIHWRDGLLAAGLPLELAVLVLALLVVFAVVGAGPISVQAALDRRADALGRARARDYPEGTPVGEPRPPLRI